MDERSTTMIVVFLLCVVADMLAGDHTLDVCATCHTNATCEEKSDGSGKVCNCNYGFVGNGRTFCQDKDECQIGASKICGQHTTCHNTYGSYYCTCLAGYSPSNNLPIFIPNDGTHCQDIDECRIDGLCGDGGQCRNLEGSFECRCQLGYEVHNGAEPFHPHRDRASCKVVDCGQPPSVEDTLLLSVTGTTYRSVAMYMCDEGFVWRSGDNSSVCGADRQWRRPTMVCEDIDECRIDGLCGDGGQCRNLEGSFECRCQLGYEVHNGAEPFRPHRDRASCKVVDCGQPPSVEDTLLLSVTGTTYRSVAMYVCDEGFVWRSGDNSSVCGADRQWRRPTMVCEEVDCGSPLALPHSHMLWNKNRRMGTEVLYQCNYGYHNVGKGNKSICTAAGQWERPSILCQETFCGSPPIIESTEQVWNNNSTPGSTVLYICKEGFYNKGGHNVSICNENGQWTPPTLTCQEILCGDPPILPHTGLVWNGSFTPGSTVTYYCNIGFYHDEGKNISLCTVNGYWTKPNITCKEVDCGEPPLIPYSVMMWDYVSTVGSQVVYQCNSGYHNVGEGNISVCTARGEWDAASLICKEINCQHPVFKPHAKMLWDGTSHMGSVVYYQCEEGYYTRSQRNYSVCGENGQWQDIELWCEEISCGPPLNILFTNLLWDRTSRPGSVVLYVCMDGFYQESGNNMSTCLLSGEWGKVSMQCKVVVTGSYGLLYILALALCSVLVAVAFSTRCPLQCKALGNQTELDITKCGPVPFLANSEVVWHNRSVVIHSCVEGYHSWKGSNVSLCGSSGLWQKATLRCIEIKPPINHLLVLNEKCLHWKAEKYEEDTEIYKVTYVGSRDYQRSFHDKRKQILTSMAGQLKLCLNLLPVTNYSISVTAVSAQFTATITTNTSLREPPAPVVYYREFETPVPTLRLRRSPNTLDPISLYQVFVLHLEGIMVFDCSSPVGSDPSKEYITAQIDVRHVGTEINFTVGDGLYYGGFFNAPLENGRNYYIILRAVSQWKMDTKSSCVLWAKVRGTSFVLMVSSLSTAAAIGLFALVILVGYSFIYGRFFKET